MNRHLIADHLSWFTESTSDPKTIEQMIEAKGGKVKRGVSYVDGKGYETVEMLGDIEETSKSG
jgi:protein import protein ZIM17